MTKSIKILTTELPFSRFFFFFDYLFFLMALGQASNWSLAFGKCKKWKEKLTGQLGDFRSLPANSKTSNCSFLNNSSLLLWQASICSPRASCIYIHIHMYMHLHSLCNRLPSPSTPVGAETIRTLNELPLNLIAAAALFALSFVWSFYKESGSGWLWDLNVWGIYPPNNVFPNDFRCISYLLVFCIPSTQHISSGITTFVVYLNPQNWFYLRACPIDKPQF